MSDGELVIRRTYAAPRERVWRAFTDPDEFARWFVPDGMEMEMHALEAEPGGTIAFVWTDGEQRIDNEGTVVEVVDRERLVTVEELPAGELRLTYEFRDAGDSTEVIVTQAFPDAVPDGAEEGWGAILDNLEAVLER